MRSIIISLFHTESETGQQDLERTLLETPYTEGSGFGFEHIDAGTDQLSAVLIKRNTTFIYEYDAAEKNMVKKQIMLFSEIPFEIDLKYHVLSVFGQALYLNQLKSAFRNILDIPYTFGHTDLSPYTIYTALKAKTAGATIQSLGIDNFVYENGISGKLLGRVIDSSVAEALFDTYKTDVSKALFSIPLDREQHFGLQVAANGALKFHSREDDFQEHFNFFKQTLFQ